MINMIPTALHIRPEINNRYFLGTDKKVLIAHIMKYKIVFGLILRVLNIGDR